MFWQLSLAAMLTLSWAVFSYAQPILEPSLQVQADGVVYASPTIGPGGVVFFGTQDAVAGGMLIAVDRNGQELWRFHAADWVDSTAAISPDGETLYVGSWDSAIHGIATSSGNLKWSYQTSGYIISSPAVSADGQSIYVGSGDGFLYALSPPTQGSEMTLQWDYLADGEIESSPMIGPDGTIYFGSVNGTVYAVNPDGNTKWTYAVPAGEGEDPRIYSSPAMDLDGTLYIGAGSNQLLALDSETGDLIWSFPTWGAVDSSPAIDSQGNIYFADRNGSFFSVSPSGVLRWSYEVGISLYSSPAIGQSGQIYATGYLGDDRSCLYAFSPDGELLWYYDFPGKVDSSPTLDAFGNLWIGSHSEGLMCFAAGDVPASRGWPQFRFNHERRGSYMVPLPSRSYFAGAHENLGGWIFYPRLGWVYVDDFPWVFQDDHGWWWVAAEASRLIVYDAYLGWTYTDLWLYPTLYSYDLNRWQSYIQGKSPARVFWAYGANEAWINEGG